MTTDAERLLVSAQAERDADPETERLAKKRADLASEIASRSAATQNRQLAALRKAPRIEQKIFWLRRMVGVFGEAAASVAPCRVGCSECCHQSVIISGAEAEIIAKETGAPMREPTTYRAERAETADTFRGKPCPFLRGNACSIYASRPIACRLLYSMDSDNLLCRIVPGSPARVPYANAMIYHGIYVEAHLPRRRPSPDDVTPAALRMADIRDFFGD